MMHKVVLVLMFGMLGCGNQGSEEEVENMSFAPREEVFAGEEIESISDGLEDPTEYAPTGQVNEKTPPSQTQKQVKQEATMLAGHYNLVVSFYSPGQGINREAYSTFMEVLSGLASELEYEETRWGREGERDLCIRYLGKAAANPSEMTKRLKKAVSGYDRVNISENSPCVHKS